MIIRREILEGIREGRVELAFRRWRRPTVRAGGTLLTAFGQLEIAAVETIDARAITEVDARRAGYASRAVLVAGLARRPDGDVYRITFGAMQPDPRVALRERLPDAGELSQIRARLRRLDGSARPWTRQVLELIRAHPARRAADLCTMAGQDRDAFKDNVRKLKRLGLTESLAVGYRLSPRGHDVLRALQSGDGLVSGQSVQRPIAATGVLGVTASS